MQGRRTVAVLALACLVLVPSWASALEPRAGSGSPGAHGEPEVRYGPVRTERSDGVWIAEQRVLVTNDFGGARFAAFDVGTFQGEVEARHTTPALAVDPGDYVIRINKTARGLTRSQALERLGTVEMTVEDSLRTREAGGLTVSAAVEARGGVGGRTPPPSGPVSSLHRADVDLHLPVGPLHDVGLDSGRGDVRARGAFPSLSARTDRGGVEATLQAWANGSVDLVATGGPVHARLVGSNQQGFDALAETRGHGQAHAAVANAPSSDGSEYEAPTPAVPGDLERATSRAFQDRPVRTEVHAKARNAPATVEAGPEGPTWLAPREPTGNGGVDATDAAAEQPTPNLDPVQTTAWAAVGIGITAVMAALWARFRGAFPLALSRLYSRIPDDEVLDQPTRREIRDLVRCEPGIHFRAILRELDLSEGQLNHHLDKLLDAGVLEQTRGPGHRCLFPAGRFRSDVQQALAQAKAEGAIRVLASVEGSPPGSLHELADRAGLAPSTASYHVTRLEAEEVLETRREGRALSVHLTDLGRRVRALLVPD